MQGVNGGGLGSGVHFGNASHTNERNQDNQGAGYQEHPPNYRERKKRHEPNENVDEQNEVLRLVPVKPTSIPIQDQENERWGYRSPQADFFPR
jgi:hypothetical protein